MRATFMSRDETYQLASTEIPITAIPANRNVWSNSCQSPDMSLNAASMMMTSAATKISTASTSPDISSNFPCPNEWPASGGSADFFTEKKAMTAASRSMDEWIASEMILTEPSAKPTANFISTSPVLEITDRCAVCAFNR